MAGLVPAMTSWVRNSDARAAYPPRLPFRIAPRTANTLRPAARTIPPATQAQAHFAGASRR